MPDWLLYILAGGLAFFILYKIKQIGNGIIIALFGKDKTPDFKELTGALAFIQLAVMFIKHDIDSTYIPDSYILNLCAGIVLILAGIAKGSDLLSQHIETRNKTKDDGKQEGMDI